MNNQGRGWLGVESGLVSGSGSKRNRLSGGVKREMANRASNDEMGVKHDHGRMAAQKARGKDRQITSGRNDTHNRLSAVLVIFCSMLSMCVEVLARGKRGGLSLPCWFATSSFGQIEIEEVFSILASRYYLFI